jgi:hypothetical protein
MYEQRVGGDPSAHWDMQKIIPTLNWNDKLTPDEIKSALSKLQPVDGQDPYERFMELRQSPHLAGRDYSIYERNEFSDYSPRDLGTEASTSFVDSNAYYKPEIVGGKLVRKTNLGIGMENALKSYLARTNQ